MDTSRNIPDDKHGTVSGYRHWGCRCDRCRTACREYEQYRRDGDPTIQKKQNARTQKWKEKNPEKVREVWRRIRYRVHRVAEEDVQRLEIEQGGNCAICQKPETAIRNGRVKRLAIDHCHATKRIRGLLCTRCNQGVGCFLDNPELLRRAAVYLEDTTNG